MTQSYIFPIANWIYYWLTHSVKLKLIYRKFGSITTEFVQLLTSSHWTLAHHCQIIIHYNNSLHHCIYLYYFAWVLLYTVVCCKEKKGRYTTQINQSLRQNNKKTRDTGHCVLQNCRVDNWIVRTDCIHFLNNCGLIAKPHLADLY